MLFIKKDGAIFCYNLYCKKTLEKNKTSKLKLILIRITIMFKIGEKI